MKECEFIEVKSTDESGEEVCTIWVQRPTSWIGGWARHQWLKRYFKQGCSIASPEFWDVLVASHGPIKVLSDLGGIFKVDIKK